MAISDDLELVGEWERVFVAFDRLLKAEEVEGIQNETRKRFVLWPHALEEPPRELVKEPPRELVEECERRGIELKASERVQATRYGTRRGAMVRGNSKGTGSADLL